MRNALTTLILMLSLSASLFGATSVGTLTWDSSTLQLKQPSGFFDSNAVKIGYALNGSNKITAESIGARPSYTLGGYTNRLTWQGIVVDSRPIVQAAIDDVYARGGGVVELGHGDWRFGNDTNAGTLYMKPRVALIGTGKPMSDDSYEGTYSATNVIRISHSTMLHFAGGQTNGYGAPCIALVGTPYYTNQYYQAFADALGEWVAYYRGGNVIANLGIWSGWKWAWNSSNAPAAAIYINEVAGTTIDNVFIGPTAGPGIYIRGGFGTRIYDSYIVNSIAGGVVVADTSDTWIDRTSIPSPNGSSVAYVGSTRTNGTFVQTANTHKLVNVAFWNNREELSGWVGTSTTYTNGGIVESVGVRRTGYTADASTDSIGIALRVGSDTGLPVMVRGTSLPGGLNTNTVYFVRWGAQGGTNLQLCLTSGRALNGGAAVDITSSGGSDTWWLESPSAFVFGSDAQEIQIEGARMDQSWSTIVELRRSQRSKISGIHAFEVGLNQTEIRQSRKQTFFEPTIAAFKFVDCSDISLTDNQIIGSKGNTGLSSPWIYNPVGVSIVRGQDFVISGNLFDRLNTAILIDSESGNISTDGNAIGGWVARPLDSGSTYGIAPHTPYFDGRTNSQIVAPIATAFTNVSGDFAVAFRARVPSMLTNGFANGRHSPLVNLSSVTNTTGDGALVPYAAQVSWWRSSLDNSMNVVGTLCGSNFVPSNPSSEAFRFGAGVTPFMGKDVEVLVQRQTNWMQIYVEGIRVANVAITTTSGTGSLYAPYLLIGQVADASQYSHPQAPIYGVAYHVGKSFSTEEINQGMPWGRKGGTNAALLWDFSGASLASGVMDLSGNGSHGVVQQIGSVAPEFGTSDDFTFSAGANMTITRTGKKSWTFASSAGGGGGGVGTITNIIAADTNVTIANGGGPAVTVGVVRSNLYKAVLNSGVPNGTGSSVDWSQLKNVPSGLADGTDDGAGGSGISTNDAAPGYPIVLNSALSPVATNSLTVSNLTADVLNLTSPIPPSAISNAMATDAEVAAGYVPNSRSIYTSNSITGGGDLSANLTLSLVNDSASPGANKYYGTDGTGTLGYQSLPGFGGSTNGVSEAPSNGVAFVRQDESWKTNSFSLISGTAADGQIPSAIARDSEVAAAYQGINTNLTDLADGSLTPARVGFQSGPVNGRASTFGDYIRSIHTNQPVSIPTEPRLLLLAPIGGQSLATGSGGVTNSFSTNPRHPGYSLSWTQGVHYGEPGTAGVVIASSALTATKDLFAEVVAGPGRSETPVVAAVDYWNTYWSNNVAGNRARVLAVTHGLGGAELNAIDEGTASFSNLVAHIQGAANIAVASNWVLNVPVWYFVHGENDTYLDTPELNYRTNFMTMYDRMNSITKAASGQSNDPVVIMTQTASRTYENQSNSWPANAQLFLNLSSEGKVKVAVPTYTFPTVADGVHLTNIVSAWLGEYLSKAARHELFGLGWNPVMPTNVAVSGTNVVIKYHVPKPPLVFDTNLVSNPGSFGYALDGATIGTPKVSGNVVTIPFTAGSPTRVKYGWNGTLGAADGPTTGQRGNLRDSDLEVGSLTGSNLYNWGLIFNLPTTAPSTPSGLLAASGNGKITLSWNRVSDASFYSLKRALGSGGPYTTIKVTNGSSFEDTDVAPLVTYYYVVTAKGPSGESSQSAEVVGTTSGGTSTTRSWVPTDLGSRLAGWYRASSVSVGENNPIDSWTDESGNGYHLTGSSTVRPTQQTVSGRTVVRFDGTDDRLDQASIGTKFSGIGEANFWTVGRPNTTNVTAGNRNLWYMSRATNGSVRLSLAQSSITPGRWRFGGSRVDGDSTDNDDSGTLIDTNSTVILHAKFDFSNADKFLNTNGVVDTSDTSFASAGTTAAESLSLYRMGASALAAGGAATNWYAGDIEMQIITTGVITTDEQQKIEGYIAHALGLTNLLDAAHPYKTNAPVITVGSSGNGDVVGPSSSVDGELAIMSGTTGKLLRSGGVFRVSQSNIVAIGSVTNYVVDLALASIQLLVATNDVNFLHATNAAAGRGSTILIQASGANRTITLPANLKRTKSSVVVTNASILPINFYAHGPDNTNVIATVGSEGF